MMFDWSGSLAGTNKTDRGQHVMKLSFSPAIIKKALKILAIFMTVIAVTGFLILPDVLRPVLEKKMSEAIHRPVAIRAVYINPLTLAFALRGVTINQRDSSEVM